MESTANIYKERDYYRVLLNVSATKMINSDEICFDKENLVLRIPTIYDNRRYKLYGKRMKNSAFVFTYDRDREPGDDITGKYRIEKEDDDYYFVKK